MTRVVLLYQNGLAHVFDVNSFDVGDVDKRMATRIYQHAWDSAVNFVRGMAQMGAVVRTAHCDVVGEVLGIPWTPGTVPWENDAHHNTYDREEITLGKEIPEEEQRRYHSLYVLKTDDGGIEVEIDGPHDLKTRNARAACWDVTEKESGDKPFKVELREEGKIVVEPFERADMTDGARTLAETAKALKALGK